MEKSDIKMILNGISIKRSSELSDAEKAVLREAAHSTDRDLYNEACLAVHECLKKYECKILSKQGVTGGHQNFEDYRDDMFVVIMENLKDWDPAKGDLSTWFKPHFQKVCVLQRAQTRAGKSSRYYENIATLVDRARKALVAESGEEPTSFEVQAYMKLIFKVKNVSIHTIEQALSIAQPTVPLDLQEWSLKASDRGNPLEEFLREEHSELVRKCIKHLEPFYQRIIGIEYDIYKRGLDQGKHIANQMIADLYNERYGGHPTAEWIKIHRACAERELMKAYDYSPTKDPVPFTPFCEMRRFCIQEEQDIIFSIENIYALGNVSEA